MVAAEIYRTKMSCQYSSTKYQSSCPISLRNISLLARSNNTFCIYTEYKEKESRREAHKVVAEAHKVVAEAHKVVAEAHKVVAEARKVFAEARKVVVKAQKVP